MAQRASTDKSLTLLNNKIKTTDQTKITEKFAKLLNALPKSQTALATHRQAVDAKGLNLEKAAGAYTAMIKSDLAVVSAMMAGMTDGEAVRRIIPYIAAIQAKEYASQERAVVTAVVLDMNFEPSSLFGPGKLCTPYLCWTVLIADRVPVSANIRSSKCETYSARTSAVSRIG
jgi:hypothetical protein